MTNYSTYWRTTVLASIILHIFAWIGFNLILPHLMPKPEPADVVEMSWIDVDLTEDEPVIVEEVEPIETPTTEVFTIPEYEFPPLIIPAANEPVYIEEPKQPQKVETPPLPALEPPPQIPSSPALTKDETEILNQLEKNPEAEIVVPTQKGKQQLGEPPVTITEEYPPPGSGLNYKGYVSVAATIGVDGKVKKTKIMRTSGRMVVDNIAMNAAAKWTFKPALDQEGKPMECDKIITFDFKKFA